MRSIALSLLLGLSVAGCAHSPSDRPPICDGRHLRPANPYGSVLMPATPASNSSPPKGDARKAPPPKAISPDGGCS